MGRAMLISLLLGLLLVGAGAQEEACTPFEEAANGAGLTTLRTALDNAGLLESVGEIEDVTILAPSNEAFESAAAALGVTVDELTTRDDLNKVLLYHIFNPQLFASDFVDGQSYETLLGNDSDCGVSSVTAAVDGASVTLVGGVTNASVTEPGLVTCSGIVHVIDFVLLPCPLGGETETVVDDTPELQCQSLTEAAEANGFTTLLDKLTEAELDLSDFGPDLTIFAPTNEAFDAIEAELGSSYLTNDNEEERLSKILTYHLLGSKTFSSNIQFGVATETLSGNDSSCGVSTLSFASSDDGSVVVNGGASTATVVTADVDTCDGVVHVVDTVLRQCPPPSPVPSPEITSSPSPPTPGPEPQCQSLTEAAEANGFTTLLDKLAEVGLDLSDFGPDLTVFAPTDAAFDAIEAELGSSYLTNDNEEERLSKILTYHLLGGKTLSSDIEFGVDTETLLGANDSSCGVSTLSFGGSDDGNVVVNGGASTATVVTADVDTCDGVVHVVDTVLRPCPPPPPPPAQAPEVPPSPSPAPGPVPLCKPLIEAAEEAGLTTLLAALVEADLADSVAGSTGLTIFAPTNEAFDSTVAQLGITITELTSNKDLLQQVLLYHVLNTRVVVGDIVYDVGTETLLGNDSTCDISTVSFQRNGDDVIVNGGGSSATVVTSNVDVCSGVLHIIDNVLLPCPSPPPPGPAPGPLTPPPDPAPRPTSEPPKVPPANMSPSPVPPSPAPQCEPLIEAAEDSGLSTLVAALVKADLADTLSDEGALTIFAPTNDAFDALVALLGITITDLTSNKEVLQEVLLYHVLGVKVFSSDIVTGVDTETLLGNDSRCGVSTVSFTSTSFGDVVVNGAESSAVVVQADLVTCSGVVHVIDDVLLPCPPPTTTPKPKPMARKTGPRKTKGGHYGYSGSNGR